jgi:hypothetical protein
VNPVSAEVPSWWFERGVLDPEQAEDDYSVLNQGQLKHFALGLFEELEDRLSGGAGPELVAFMERWITLDAVGKWVAKTGGAADDFATVNLGQLKSVASPFLARLESAGKAFPAPYSDGAPDDYAYATVGQAKALFNVELGPPAVSGVSVQETADGLSISWSAGGSALEYRVLGVNVVADTPTYEVLSSTLSEHHFLVSSLARERFRAFAIQVGLRGVWGAITMLHALERPPSVDPAPLDVVSDRDGDGVPDFRDAWPDDPDYAPPAVSKPSLAVLPLPPGVEWMFLNERGSVAGHSPEGAMLWRNGKTLLLRAGARVEAMNDRDQVLLSYDRPAKPSEYDLNVAISVGRETGPFEGAVFGSEGEEALWYPEEYSSPKTAHQWELEPLMVSVCAVWSEETGLVELVEEREVSRAGRWPRWTNGSRLFGVLGRWIDNQGVVYGVGGVCLLFRNGALGPVGLAASAGTSVDEFGNVTTTVPWGGSLRWDLGSGMAKWQAGPTGEGGFIPKLQPSGEGVGLPHYAWFQDVSLAGQTLVCRWNEALGVFDYEWNGQRFEAGGTPSEISEPAEFDGQPVLYGDWDGLRTIWIRKDGAWLPKPLVGAHAHRGRFGSLTCRLQRDDCSVAGAWSVDAFRATFSGVGLADVRPVSESGLIQEDARDRRALLIPVAPAAQEVFMLSGHDLDVLELSVGAPLALDVEWTLGGEEGAQGVFQEQGADNWAKSGRGNQVRFRAGVDGRSDMHGHRRAQSPGRNTLQMRVAGELCWEKPLEVLPIVSRGVWGAASPVLSELEGMAGLNALTIHHTSRDAFGVEELVRIQQLHMAKGLYSFTHPKWADIGYHFFLDPSNGDEAAPGVIFEGRQLEGLGLAGGPYTKGSGVLKKNTLAGLHLCVLGNYDRKGEAFTSLRARRLAQTVSALCRRYKIGEGQVGTHRGVADALPMYETTECPGWQVTLNLSPNILRRDIAENLR